MRPHAHYKPAPSQHPHKTSAAQATAAAARSSAQPASPTPAYSQHRSQESFHYVISLLKTLAWFHLLRVEPTPCRGQRDKIWPRTAPTSAPASPSGAALVTVLPPCAGASCPCLPSAACLHQAPPCHRPPSWPQGCPTCLSMLICFPSLVTT